MERIQEYLFNSAAFLPHGTCLLWRPDLLAMHALGDGLIALSYFTIPVALVVFARRRSDLQYKWLFGLFALFILACGATHLLGLVTLWQPIYGVQGIVKLATAVVSLLTAILLWPIIPKALAIPGPSHLRDANMRLSREIRERKAAQDELQRAYAMVEHRVAERTRELADANKRLQLEVAERKRSEEQQAMLVAELAHRVRNTLAIVRSMASQTVRHSQSLEQFEASFDGRVQALAHVHTLLISTRWARTDLRALFAHHLKVYAPHGAAVSLSGPTLPVLPKAAVTLGLVFHELAVNATKYGSLSVPDGRVEVRWRVRAVGGSQKVVLFWREVGGPPVSLPKRQGFGGKLITFSIAHEFGGKAQIVYRPAGVKCRLTLPLRDGMLAI